MIEPGDIFEKNGERVVVYYVRDDGTAVYSEALPYGRNGARSHSCLGPGAIGRFIGAHGSPKEKMTFAGAYKLYRRERAKRAQLEKQVDRLRHQIAQLG